MASESITNRKALRDYRILDRYEAGIELKGSEVKSIRGGKANISDAFARIENGEAFLYNADIQPYERASHEIPPAKRVRKLLLHRQEIDKLYGETQVKGRALVVLKLVRNTLLFFERAHPRGFDRADVDEGIAAPGFVGDEAVALGIVEKFHCADWHI